MYKEKLFVIAVMTVLALSACGKEKTDVPNSDVVAENIAEKSAVEEETSVTENTKITKDNFRDFPVSDESIFGFDIVDDGIEVGGCKRDVEDKVIVVPETVNGKKVVSIGFGAFTELENVEAIVLPDSVERIATGAFTSCEKLRFVYLGKGIKSTGDLSFNYCPALKEIELPEGTKTMHGIFITGCPSLEVITVPATVEDVGVGIVSPHEFNGVIRTPAGSAAEKFALEYEIKVENY